LPVLLLVFGTAAAEKLPARLSNEAFWHLVTNLSEAGGTFPSDNFISNERLYQNVLDDLKARVEPGGVYIGVGPEQNFTYIAALKPRMAFIVDIRRQNLVTHLMYKALFELSADRREFLSRLFSRPIEAREFLSLDGLLMALQSVPADPEMFNATLAGIKEHLTGVRGFTLTTWDESNLEYVLRAFFVLGPAINYNGPATKNPGNVFPNFEQLFLEVGPGGTREHFLSSEANFLSVQRLQRDNMIIPVVGNFAGMSAIRAVGDYLREHAATVSAFYTSNVEQYLFMDGSWPSFYRNTASLPSDSSGVFIRTLVRTDKGTYAVSPAFRPTYRIETALFSVNSLLSKFEGREIENYADVLRTGNLTGPDISIVDLAPAAASQNVALIEWPNLRPPAWLDALAVSSSAIDLKWPNSGQGDKTGFLISRQVQGQGTQPIPVKYAAVCGADPCVFRDSGLKPESRYCYYIQAVTDYSNIHPQEVIPAGGLREDFGDPSATACRNVPAGAVK
jgi:hypothetical protein